MVLLCNRLLSTRDPNDGLTPTVVIVRQVDYQPLETAPRIEEMTIFLGLSHHIKSEEVFDPPRIRGEQITKGFEAQDDTPAPATKCEVETLK